jgi:hypothetical protein
MVIWNGHVLRSGVMHRVKKALGMIQACLAGLTYASNFSSHKLEIFLPAPADSFSMLRLCKHMGLSFSHLIIFHLTCFLQADALHRACITQFSAKWSGLPGKLVLENLTMQAQLTTFPIPSPPLLTHKCITIGAIYPHWENMDKSKDFASCIPPPSSISFNPTPIHIGILCKYCKKGRHLYSAATQTLSGHRFFQEYLSCFHLTADNNILCPCHALPPQYFTCHHILIQCPLHTIPHHCHFGNRLTLDFILGTEDGGNAFAEFVDETGVFLHPLPPRPDLP